MHSFKDNAGRTWSVAVNVATIKRVRGLVTDADDCQKPVDLMAMVEGDLLKRLYTDPVLLVDVLYAVCKPEVDKAEVTDVEFGEAMAGDAIDLGTAALIEEIIDFFPSRRDRERARKVMAKFQETVDRVQDALDLKAESPALQRELDRIVDSVGLSSGSSPESLE